VQIDLILEPHGFGVEMYVDPTPYHFEVCAENIGSMPNLLKINFFTPGATGELPKRLFESPKLESISILNFPLGNLPSLELLPHLTELKLLHNNISGPFPSLAHKRRLREVNIQGNPLQRAMGNTAGSFDNCSELRKLVITDTEITELFSFEGSTKLESIDLSHNGINSKIPEAWRLLIDLKTLDLSYNDIPTLITWDTILNNWSPSPLKGMVNIKSVELSHNEIADSVGGPNSELGFGTDWCYNLFTVPGGQSAIGIQNLDLSYNKLHSLDEFGASDAVFEVGLGMNGGELPSMLTFSFASNLLAGVFDLADADTCHINFDGSYNKLNGVKMANNSPCIGKYGAMMRIDMSNQVSSRPRFLALSHNEAHPTGPTLDGLLALNAGLKESTFLPSAIAPFQKAEYPKGSGVYPFSCTQWVFRQNPSGVVSIDPDFYEYTGGTTPELRMNWFDKKLVDSYLAYEARFGGPDGFCKCDLPYVGTPPNCVYACGRSNYAESPGACKQCPDGVDCAGIQQELLTLQLEPNYWRMSSNSTKIQRCPTVGACIGGQLTGVQGTGYCNENHEGPYCSVCKVGSAPQDGRCIDCGEIQGNSKAFVFAAVAVVLAALAYFSYHHVTRFKAFVKKLQTRSMLVKLKQMAAFFQIVLLLPSVYIVPYPTDYIAFLSIFSFVNINLIQIFSLGEWAPSVAIGSDPYKVQILTTALSRFACMWNPTTRLHQRLGFPCVIPVRMRPAGLRLHFLGDCYPVIQSAQKARCAATKGSPTTSVCHVFTFPLVGFPQ
jgi:hypothetical protein